MHNFNLFQKENLTIVSSIFLPGSFANLAIVSISLSNGKSNRCFNNFLAVDFRQPIHSFNLVFKWKNERLFQPFFGMGF